MNNKITAAGFAFALLVGLTPAHATMMENTADGPVQIGGTEFQGTSAAGFGEASDPMVVAGRNRNNNANRNNNRNNNRNRNRNRNNNGSKSPS